MTGPFAQALLTDGSVELPPAPRPTEQHLQDARRVVAGRWLLVGEEYDLGPVPDWTVNPSGDKEWQIAQHKHYFGRNLLHAWLHDGDPAYLHTWARHLRSWLAGMGTGFIAVSDAQVEALRLRSWVESLLLLRAGHAAGRLAADDPHGVVVDDDLLHGWVDRMGHEAQYVATHLKPVRNHRTFQLHSVFLVGVCVPQAPGAAELVTDAVRLLTENLLAELLPDGVQVEMATHYHQLVAETALDVATLAARNGIALDPALLERIHAATRWSAWLTWPDGRIPLLGDSDDGDHAPLLLGAGDLFEDPELVWAGSRGASGRPPATVSRDFPDAGYTVLRDGWGTDPDSYRTRTHVVVDTARLGEGAHAHYDALSLVLHCDGVPALVDPGRYTYSGEPDADGVDWRHTFKSTRAHNTVTVDGRDQTRHVSRNKHGPDAEVRDRAVHLGRRTDWVAASVASHEYPALHTRVVVFPHRQYLLVVDRVAADDGAEHDAELAWHLPAGLDVTLDVTPDVTPDVNPVTDARTGVTVSGAPARLLLDVPAGAQVGVDDGWVSTLYGVKHPAPVVRARARGHQDLLLVTAAAPLRTGVRLVGLVPLADQEDTAGAAGGTPAWQVTLDVDGERFVDRLWAPDGPGPVRAPDVDADVRGRFLLVRTAADGSPVHATGERVTGTVSDRGLDALLDEPQQAP